MSHNQFRTEKMEGHLKRPGQSRNFGQNRGFSGGGAKGGGPSAPRPALSPFAALLPSSAASHEFSTIRSNKKSVNGQREQSRTNLGTLDSDEGNRAVQNGSHAIINSHGARFKQALKIRNPKNRLKRIYDACKSKKKCVGGDDIDVQGQQDSEEPMTKSRGGCGAQQPNITIDGMKMIAEYKSPKKKSDDQEQLPEHVERKQVLSVERVLSVLKRISDDDCQLLGLNPKYERPDWMILQVLPISPPPVRPSIMMDTSSRSELAMIIRHNENLRRQERNGAPAHIIAEFAQLLQFHIAIYFDNELPGQPRAILPYSQTLEKFAPHIQQFVLTAAGSQAEHVIEFIRGSWGGGQGKVPKFFAADTRS